MIFNLIKASFNKILNFYFKLCCYILKIRYNYILPLPQKNILNAFDFYHVEELKSSYEFFKKYFKNAIFLDVQDILLLAINKSKEYNHKNNFFLEFGVFKGNSINKISKHVDKIYGFDSFEGLREDWKGWTDASKAFELKKKKPSVRNNVILIDGWVQDTLEPFLKNNKPNISFIHMDLDTYESSKYVLQKIKPYLLDNCIILFDELYNYPGWSVGEHKALKEVFSEKEFEYLAFGLRSAHVMIKFNKKINNLK